MKKTAFLQKLALERCQQYVAQLHAITFLETDETFDGHPAMNETIRVLVTHVSNDLDILEDYLGEVIADSGLANE